MRRHGVHAQQAHAQQSEGRRRKEWRFLEVKVAVRDGIVSNQGPTQALTAEDIAGAKNVNSAVRGTNAGEVGGAKSCNGTDARLVPV